MKHTVTLLTALLLAPLAAPHATGAPKAESNVPVEITFEAAKPHPDPFVKVVLDIVFTDPTGARKTVPAFWAGGNQWKVRYASPLVGRHRYRSQCSDTSDAGLHGIEGQLEITLYTGSNPLYRHGPLRVSQDKRHFEHADGTPFFWLADTWWKGLAKRLTWEGFQELAANRKAKGFSVVQIVCGAYPDEGAFEARWENEGGKPYETRDYSVVNPRYFEYADRRLQHLVETGIMPAIVGAWGRSDCDAMQVTGLEGIKRHWRHLVARYGAYPVVWIVGGEIDAGAKWGRGPWGEVARYLRAIDPYRRLLTCHAFSGVDKGDELLVDFNMAGGSHRRPTAASTLSSFTNMYFRKPTVPVLCGETGYEGHMQRHFQDVQRHVFWMYMLSGAAGHTYGAAGMHHMGVEGDPGLTPVWDYTTWKEAMHFPGAVQVGLGKKLLEQYPWWRFEPHPEWTGEGCFAAGIPGQLRFIYMPKRSVYDWSGPRLRNLEPDVPYRAFYFDPATGRRFDLGTIMNTGHCPKPFDGHAELLLFEDRFEEDKASAWTVHGSPTGRQDGFVAGVAAEKDQVEMPNMVVVLDTIDEKDLMASVEANSNADAGIILRFHDLNNYLAALYSPRRKAIYLLDRRNGRWGPSFAYRIPQLGIVDVPEIGPKIRLTAAACGDYAAVVLTDGTRTYHTPAVRIGNVNSGKTGLWLSNVGKRQKYGKFEVSRTRFAPLKNESKAPSRHPISRGSLAPAPSPQDWVLVLERLDQ